MLSGLMENIFDDRSAFSGGVWGATINFFLLSSSYLTHLSLTGANSSHLLSNWRTLTSNHIMINISFTITTSIWMLLLDRKITNKELLVLACLAVKLLFISTWTIQHAKVRGHFDSQIKWQSYNIFLQILQHCRQAWVFWTVRGKSKWWYVWLMRQ